MDNSFFLFSESQEPISVERFHICTWEFGNASAIVEFGVEVSKESIIADSMQIELYVPWISKGSKVKDFYSSLVDTDNSRFIFNDSIKTVNYVNEAYKTRGVIHSFPERGDLTILPLSSNIDTVNKIISIRLDFRELKANAHWNRSKSNVYFRFAVETNVDSISTRDTGIGKTTIIYDLKLNEKRNLPDSLIERLAQIKFCKVKTCFCFHIVPNRYQIQFFESNALKNIRTLEYAAFSKYLKDDRVKNNRLIVMFNKKSEQELFSFFSVFSDERIGTPHFTLGIFASMFSGILLYLPQLRKDLPNDVSCSGILSSLDVEIWLVILLVFGSGAYFGWSFISSIWRLMNSKFPKA